MLQAVVQVKPTRDFKVFVYFADGHIKLYDMNSLIGKGVFQKIADPEFFVSSCTVINGTLAWDIGGGFDPYKCIDIDPETIYAEGLEVKDPLAEDAA
jgi:hypothetical protein